MPSNAGSRRAWLRRAVLAVVLMTLLPVAPVAAQEPIELPPLLLDQFGVTADDVVAAEPNRAWDGLGLFSEDALRVLTVAAQPTEVTLYGSTDDPSGRPVIEPDGANPLEIGAMLWTIPAGWTPPAPGLTDTMAFAETELSRLEGGDDVMLFWVRFDSDYDFGSGLSISEGFPLVIPGLPVWEPTAAGDTWAGANLVPNAQFDDETGVLRLDVWQWNGELPFAPVDLPSFYYRSGDIMAIAVSAPALAAVIDQAQPASADAAGIERDLLYRGDRRDISAQAASYEALQGLPWTAFSHLTEGAQFSPGFIFRTVAGGLSASLLFLLSAGLLIDAPLPPELDPSADEGDGSDTGGLGVGVFVAIGVVLVLLLVSGARATRRRSARAAASGASQHTAEPIVVTEATAASLFLHGGQTARIGRRATANRPLDTAPTDEGLNPEVEERPFSGREQRDGGGYSYLGHGFELDPEAVRPQYFFHLGLDRDVIFGFEYHRSSQRHDIAADPMIPFDSGSIVCLWESDGPPVVGVVGPPGFADAGGRVIARWCGPLDERGVAPCGLDEIDLSMMECDQYVEEDVQFCESPTRARQGADVLFVPVGDGALVSEIRMAYAPDVGLVNTELAVDIFNEFNRDLVRRHRRVANASTFGAPVEVLGPRLIRFGAKVGF